MKFPQNVLNAMKRRRLKPIDSASDSLAGFSTRRQWFAGAAGAVVGGSALVAENALRPTSALAQSSSFVDTTSNQTIGGIKTFTQAPVLPEGTFALTQVRGTAMVAANVTGPFAPSTPGAAAATRYVGGTAGGAPTTGTFAVGDFVIEQTAKMWICTVAGTPGTWAQQSGSGVDLTTDQSVGGVKTFTAAPVVPADAFPQVAVAGLVAGLAAKQATIPSGTYAGTETLGTAATALDKSVTPQTKAGALSILGDLTAKNVVHLFDKSDGIQSVNVYSDKSEVGGNAIIFDFLAVSPANNYIIFKGLYSMIWPALVHIECNSSLTGSVGFELVMPNTTPADDAYELLRLSCDTNEVPIFQFSKSGLLNTSSGKSLTLRSASGLIRATGRLDVGDLDGSLAMLRMDAEARAVTVLDTSYRVRAQFSTHPNLQSGLFRGTDAMNVEVVRVQASATPLTDLITVTSAAGAIYSRFNRDGYFMTRKVAAPSDESLKAGELAIWFDATNGAAKAMFRGKQADGTVRTAAVAMA